MQHPQQPDHLPVQQRVLQLQPRFTRRDPNSAETATSGNSIASMLLGYPANASIGAAQAREMQRN